MSMPTHKDLGFERRQKELREKRRQREATQAKLRALASGMTSTISKALVLASVIGRAAYVILIGI